MDWMSFSSFFFCGRRYIRPSDSTTPCRHELWWRWPSVCMRASMFETTRFRTIMPVFPPPTHTHANMHMHSHTH